MSECVRDREREHAVAGLGESHPSPSDDPFPIRVLRFLNAACAGAAALEIQTAQNSPLTAQHAGKRALKETVPP